MLQRWVTVYHDGVTMVIVLKLYVSLAVYRQPHRLCTKASFVFVVAVQDRMSHATPVLRNAMLLLPCMLPWAGALFSGAPLLHVQQIGYSITSRPDVLPDKCCCGSTAAANLVHAALTMVMHVVWHRTCQQERQQ